MFYKTTRPEFYKLYIVHPMILLGLIYYTLSPPLLSIQEINKKNVKHHTKDELHRIL